jgi:hypothetical protein
MLQWWQRTGVGRADLALRRTDGKMLWHHDLSLADLPLAWARSGNAHGWDVYIRPARGHSWPLVFLDDVRPELALGIAAKYSALIVETSSAGGCHVWLRCARLLDEAERKLAQRSLATRVAADPGSVSGEHLGRLAGFKNWKRTGCWVNIVAASDVRVWEPCAAQAPALSRRAQAPSRSSGCPDNSESAREWGWVCGLLEAGYDPDTVYCRLVQKARPRRGDDAERYARHTISRALGRQ